MILTNTGFRLVVSALLLGTAVVYLLTRGDCCSADSTLLAAAAIQPINMLVIATLGWRFRILAAAPRPRIWSSFKASMLATGLNILAPARAGDFLRLTYLRQREGTSLGEGISISIIERVADLIVLSGIAIIVASMVLQSQTIVPIAAILAIAIGLIMLSALLPFWLLLLRSALPASLAGFLSTVITETAGRVRDGQILLALLAATMFMSLGLVATLVFFRIATGSEFSLTLAAMVLVFATLGGAIPILPGGLATFEAGVIAALLYGGFSADESLKLAVVYRLQQYVVATPFALLIASRERVGLSAMFSEMMRIFASRRAGSTAPPQVPQNENH